MKKLIRKIDDQVIGEAKSIDEVHDMLFQDLEDRGVYDWASEDEIDEIIVNDYEIKED